MRSITLDGEQLRRLRDENRLTGKELARRVGCTPRHIYRIEHGHERVSLNLADALTEEFGVERVADLVNNAEDRAVFLAIHNRDAEPA